MFRRFEDVEADVINDFNQHIKYIEIDMKKMQEGLNRVRNIEALSLTAEDIFLKLEDLLFEQHSSQLVDRLCLKTKVRVTLYRIPC